MDNSKVKEFEKIEIINPPMPPIKDGVAISKEFEDSMKYFDYTIVDGEIIIKKVIKGKFQIEIPLGVTKIAEGAFSGEFADCLETKVEKVIVPSSVYEIGVGAFASNHFIKYVSLEKSSILKIEKGLFFGCSELYYVSLPTCVKEIEENAFTRTAIKTINIPRHAVFKDNSFDKKTAYLRGSNLYNDYLIEEYEKTVLKPKQIKESVENLEKEYENKKHIVDLEYEKKKSLLNKDELKKQEEKTEKLKLKKEDLEEKIEKLQSEIRRESINYNLLKGFIISNEIIPEDVVLGQPIKETFDKIKKRIKTIPVVYRDISENEVYEKLEEVSKTHQKDQQIIENSKNKIIELSKNKVDFDGDALEVKGIVFNGFYKIEKDMVSKFKNLEEIKLAEIKLTPRISTECFVENKKLKSVIVEDSGKWLDVGDNAFSGLENLENFDFEFVSSVRSRAFMGCKKIKKIKSKNLKFIYSSAFKNCVGLEEIDLSEVDELYVEPFAFAGCENLKFVKFNSNKTKLNIQDETLKSFMDK